MVIQRAPGRPRSSNSDRRGEIAKAASRHFASFGYDRTTIRAVAEDVGVDPRLVMHYFGNKQKLFMATVKVPAEVGAALTLLKMVPRHKWGKRIADVLWIAKSSGSFQTLVGVIRASASEPEAAEMFRDFYVESLLNPIVSSLNIDNRELRAVMLSTLVSGFVFNLEITRVFDLVPRNVNAQKKLLAAIVQTILTEPVSRA